MTSKLFKNITDKYLGASDDEEDESRNEADKSMTSSSDSDDSDSVSEKVAAAAETNQSQQQANGVVKQTFRGNAAQLLALGDSDDDDDDDDDGPGLFGGRAGSKTKAATNKTNKVGIYGKKITETKIHVKVIKNDFVSAEKGLMDEIENETRQKADEDDESEDDDSCTGPKKFKNIDSSDDSFDDEEVFAKPRKPRSQKSEDQQKAIENQENLERDLSPPPPPEHVVTKPKRKSTSLAEKQLRELEDIKVKTLIRKANVENDQNPNSSVLSSNIEDFSQIITVRVSTKTGIHKWDMNENDPFQTIFEKVAALEKKDVDSILLSLADRIIKYNDTPAGIQLKSYDIIDCVQNSRKPQERIRVIEQDQDIDEMSNGNSNVLTITLQTQEGRKSRLTFLVFKDEKFENILKKYCEKRGFDNYKDYMLEFDGDRVEDAETPETLDLDGEEIFDVKSSKGKTTLQHVKENQSKYAFDDDILIA